ncbi:MAG: hypothetical protein Q9173_000552 [Seirophora scorigena]
MRQEHPSQTADVPPLTSKHELKNIIVNPSQNQYIRPQIAGGFWCRSPFIDTHSTKVFVPDGTILQYLEHILSLIPPPKDYSAAGYTIPTDGVYKTAIYSTYTAFTRSTLGPQPPTTSPTTPPAATLAPTPGPSTGLNSGAKAGIGIGFGVAVGAYAIASLAAFFWMRRRKALQKKSTHHNGHYDVSSKEEPTYGYTGELSADAQVQKPELPSVHEVRRPMHEIQA